MYSKMPLLFLYFQIVVQSQKQYRQIKSDESVRVFYVLEYFIFKISPFFYLMSGSRSKSKDGFIRLGLKSPRNRKKGNQQNTPMNKLSHSFHIDEEKSNILAQSQKENEKSFHTHTERMSIEKSNPSTYHQPNKLPLKKSPIPRQSQKNQVSKVIIYRQPSPQRKIIINEKSKPLQSNVSFGANQHPIQYDWQRKNKILEQRIVQLHQQKQQAILKLHEENKKLNMDNVYLKQRMGELSYHLQSSKKEEGLKEKRNHPSSTKIRSHNSLKNDVYVDKDQDNNETSILKKNSPSKLAQAQNSERSLKETSIKEVKIQESLPEEKSAEELTKLLEESNRKLEQMQAMNEQLIDTVRRYQNLNEESNKKIHLLSLNEKQLIEEKENLKSIKKQKQEILETNKEQIKQNESLKVKIKELEGQLAESRNLLQENSKKYIKQHEEQISTFKQSNISLRQQMQKQINQHQKQKQLLISEKSAFQQQNVKLNKQLNEVNKALQTCQSDKEAFCKKADQLEKEMSEMKKIQTQKNIQTQGNAVVGECAKCRELLKTFMKLNSKTYQK